MVFKWFGVLGVVDSIDGSITGLEEASGGDVNRAVGFFWWRISPGMLES